MGEIGDTYRSTQKIGDTYRSTQKIGKCHRSPVGVTDLRLLEDRAAGEDGDGDLRVRFAGEDVAGQDDDVAELADRQRAFVAVAERGVRRSLRVRPHGLL